MNMKRNANVDMGNKKSSSTLSVVNCSVASETKGGGGGMKASNLNSDPESVSFPCENRLDFLGTSHAVKDLFSLPYSSKEINLAVHNLNGTLLIDAVEPTIGQTQQNRVPHPSRRKRRSRKSTRLPDSENSAVNDNEKGSDIQEANNTATSIISLSSAASSQSSEALSLISSIVQNEEEKLKQRKSNFLHKDEDALYRVENDKNAATSLAVQISEEDGVNQSSIAASTEPKEYLKWKFHDMNMLVGSNALVYKAPTDSASGKLKAPSSLTVRVEEASEMRDQLQLHEQMVRTGQFIPDHRLGKWQQLGKQSYAEALQADPQIQDDQNATNDNNQNTNKTGTQKQSKVPSFSVPDLDRVQLQTCIVPSSNAALGGLLPVGPDTSSANQSASSQLPRNATSSNPPVCAVLDAYLDNIMANVPQLALCLREKGFVRSVKLLRTNQIPSRFMHASTLDTSSPFDAIESEEGENIFSPQIMEMNASTLLRFLKANCSKDNATYLFRREAGDTEIQLYDVSSISAQRQRKWIWWLAMMSYRFAARLRHVDTKLSGTEHPHNGAALKRRFRLRQRALLLNTLDLLEELADMDGGYHETLVAEVCENLADTFLGVDEVEADGSKNADFTTTSGPTSSSSLPVTTTSSQPYSNITADALSKAQDHLTKGISKLWKVWERTTRRANHKKNRAKKRISNTKTAVVSIVSESSSSGSDEDSDESNSGLSFQSEAVTTQLLGLHHKLVNVILRLAEHHLNNYFSSSAMQSLRTAARRMADFIELLRPLTNYQKEDSDRLRPWLISLQLQYTRLWEHCGHFARSFAADELWRERGHACGDDIISVLCDVDAAFRQADDDKEVLSFLLHYFSTVIDPLSEKTNGTVSLSSLSAIITPKDLHSNVKKNHSGSCDSGEEGVAAAKALLEGKRQIQRDQWHVLVASCICYSRAVVAFQEIKSKIHDVESNENGLDPNEHSVFATEHDPNLALFNLLRQRLGDACNETGKVLLSELRGLLVSLPRTSEGSESTTAEGAAEHLLVSAEFWFHEGLEAFESCKDLRNIALLRCNLCQCYKLRANSNFANSETTKIEGSTHAEICLQEAVKHLQAAHESLGERDVDPMTWDMVSGELAATFLVLGVRRRQSLLGGGNAPVILQVLRLSPGKERSIVDPMSRALEIYEQSGNFHQAAAVHYQLALFYSKVWTCQRDEAKTREKLSAAFQHYNASHSYFSNSLRGNEPTFVLLCLDLASLYAAVSGEECLSKALLRCLDTMGAFSQESIDTACYSQSVDARKQWLEKMRTLASSVEDRVFKLLRALVKDENDATSSAGKYKEIYRSALTVKMGANSSCCNERSNEDELASNLLALHEIMRVIKNQI